MNVLTVVDQIKPKLMMRITGSEINDNTEGENRLDFYVSEIMH